MNSKQHNNVKLYIAVSIITALIGNLTMKIPATFIFCNMILLLVGPDIMRSRFIKTPLTKIIILLVLNVIGVLIIWKSTNDLEYLKISFIFSGVILLYAIYYIMVRERSANAEDEIKEKADDTSDK